MTSIDPQSAADKGPMATAMAAAVGAPPTQGGQQAQASGKEEFLKLLVAQIRNQDPMEPLDNKEMIAQLAQFTGIEQAMETNRQLTALQGMSSTQGRTAMAGLIGKNVDADASTLHWQNRGNEATAFVYNLSAPAQEVVVTVADSQGLPVRTLRQPAPLPGPQTALWDGKNDAGGLLPDGDYSVSVVASRGKGSETLAPRLRGVAGGVGFDGNGAAVLVGNARVRPQQLTQIAQ